MTYQELLAAATKVREKYNEYEKRVSGEAWNTDKLMAGFVGDVGDLSKLVMAKNGYRKIDDVDAKLAHELADCLWCILVLSDRFGIDLETEFMNTMQTLDERIEGDLAKL